MSSTYAAQLGAAFVKSYGPTFQSSWARDRGVPVDAASLLVNARIFPLHTAFDRVPDVGCHPAFVRLLGSYYLMSLDDQEPVVRMAVSAQTSDYSVNNDGYLVEPTGTGNDFFHNGIAADGRWIITPEQAVAVVATASGASVVEVPRLMRRDISYSLTAALWRIALDREIRVRRPDGTVVPTRTLFVGALPQERYFVPAAEQPTEITYTCARVDENLVDQGMATFTVKVFEDQPVDFERVTLVP